MKRVLLHVLVLMSMFYGVLYSISENTRGIPIVLRNVDQLTQIGTLGGDRIYDLTWSPDGHWLAVTGSQGRIYLYDATNFSRPPRPIQARVPDTKSVSFTADSHYLNAYGDYWDVNSGRLVREFNVRNITADWDVERHSAVHNIDERMFVVEGNAFYVVDHPTEQHPYQTSSYFRDLTITSIQLSPNGKEFVTTAGTMAVIWRQADVEKHSYRVTGTPDLDGHARLLLGHQDQIRHAEYNSDGALLVTGGNDGTIRTWDTQSGLNLLKINAHFEAVWDVDFSPDDTKLASVGWDGALRFWDAETGHLIQSRDGYHLALTSVAYSPNQPQIAFGSIDGHVWLLNTDTNQQTELRGGHSWDIWDIDFSPNDTLLASAADNNEIWLWNVYTQSEYQVLRGHDAPILSVDFSPDATRLVSGSMDQTVRVWDIERGHETFTLSGHTSPVNRVMFSPDGRIIASVERRGPVYLWDAHSGDLLHTLDDNVYATISFSADGKYLASPTRLWEMTNLPKLIDTDPIEDWPFRFERDMFNFTGTLQTSEYGVLNVETTEQLASFGADNCGHNDAIFNHEGSMVARTCSDGSIRLWGINP